MPADRTPVQLLADTLLGLPVEDYLAERRAAGRSWRKAVRDLAEATGGVIDVHEATAKRWAASTPTTVAGAA